MAGMALRLHLRSGSRGLFGSRVGVNWVLASWPVVAYWGTSSEDGLGVLPCQVCLLLRLALQCGLSDLQVGVFRNLDGGDGREIALSIW